MKSEFERRKSLIRSSAKTMEEKDMYAITHAWNRFNIISTQEQLEIDLLIKELFS